MTVTKCQTKDSFKGGRFGLRYFLESSTVHPGEGGMAGAVPSSSAANPGVETGTVMLCWCLSAFLSS